MNFESLYILLFGLITLIQLSFLFVFRFRKIYQQQYKNNDRSASVIICAKNEAENLEAFLPLMLQQEYAGDFEVIVVNDASVDNTENILYAFREQYSNLKIVTVSSQEKKTLPGKKFALHRGIAQAKNDYLLLTDADCRPAGKWWLQQMMNAANTDVAIVLGYGAYEAQSSLLNKFIRWETVNTVMQYTGLASIGSPYMGVGRNLLYRKSLLKALENDDEFREIFSSTSSGDDDLIISRIATRENLNICLNTDSKTISAPKQHWGAWWRQKTRHVSTGKYYAAKTKMVLALFALTHCLFWILFLIGCIVFKLQMIFIAIAAIRIVLYWLNAAVWYHKLEERKLSLFYPFGDLFWCIYNLILSPYIFWKNKTQWK